MGCRPSKERKPRPAVHAVESFSKRRPDNESSTTSRSRLSTQKSSNSLRLSGSKKKENYRWKAHVDSNELLGVHRSGSCENMIRTRDNIKRRPNVFSIFSDSDLASSPDSAGAAVTPFSVMLAKNEKPLLLPKLTGELFPSLGVCYGTATHIGSRAVNEDRHVHEHQFIMGEDVAYFGVFDGHGGSQVSEYLSHHLHNHLFDQFSISKDLSASVYSACKSMDDEIFKMILKGGSTAVLALIQKHRGIFVSIGDSQVVLSIKGQARDLCAIHKPEDVGERLRIEGCNGVVMNGRIFGMLGVSRAFGDNDFKTSKGEFAKKFTGDLVTCEPDVVTVELTSEEEFCVLACDGVFDVMTPQEVVNFTRQRLMEGRDVPTAAKELTDYARRLGSTDNVSAIIVAFHQIFNDL